jgi:hypothetical protein
MLKVLIVVAVKLPKEERLLSLVVYQLSIVGHDFKCEIQQLFGAFNTYVEQ